jgi:predicted transcriptional regulator
MIRTMILGAKRPDTTRKRFLIVAQLLEGKSAVKPIAEAVNLPVATVRSFLNELVDGGYATKEYRPPSSGPVCWVGSNGGNDYELTKKGLGYIQGELERWVLLEEQESEIVVMISTGLTG